MPFGTTKPKAPPIDPVKLAEFEAKADEYPPETLPPGLGSTGFDPEGVERVIRAAPAAVDSSAPWEGLDPGEVARFTFQLRLNAHDLAILRHLGALPDGFSMQQVARRILVPELRRRVGVVDDV